MSVDPVEQVNVFVQIQDSRRSGAGDPALARGTMDPAAGRLDVHQAYFTLDGLGGNSLSVKIGRQELAYGNQRLIGSVGWSNVGRSFDAVVLAHKGDRGSVDFFAARLVGAASEGVGSQNLFGLYTTWQLGRGHELDAFGLLDNDTRELHDRGGDAVDRLVRFTPGMAIRGSQMALSYELEAAYQIGKTAVVNGATPLDIGAFLLSGTLDYVIEESADATIGMGYTHLSGDSRPGDGTRGQFNTLFATNHKFYGSMDYFPSTPLGLQDLQLRTSLALSKCVKVAATFHHFAVAETRSSQPHRSLGEELDLTTTYQFADPVALGVGLSGFWPGRAMEYGRGAEAPAYWGYVTSTVTF